MSLVNDDLINALKKNTPEKKNTVDLLLSIIPLGKEAAYRRLRGEIPFTLDEAIAVCRSLNMSLDLLIGTGQKDIYAFHLNAIFAKDPMEGYANMLKDILRGVKHIMEKDPDCFSYRAYKALPQEFVYRYDSLSRIYIYILFYQLYLHSTPKGLLDIEIPREIFELQMETSEIMQDVDSVLILDKRIFMDYIEIVCYFHGLGMISDDEIIKIKMDLHLMLDDMEKCATAGTSLHNNKLDIYISNISFDCTYSYLEGAGYNACSVGVYCLDHLTCERIPVSENHKSWIKSLVRFSTLISVSGELQRNEFFNHQRSFVDEMLQL